MNQRKQKRHYILCYLLGFNSGYARERGQTK